MTAGMAPITTLGAPRCAANAGQDGRLRREGQPHEKQRKVRAERDGVDAGHCAGRSPASSARRIDEDTGKPL